MCGGELGSELWTLFDCLVNVQSSRCGYGFLLLEVRSKLPDLGAQLVWEKREERECIGCGGEIEVVEDIFCGLGHDRERVRQLG